MLNKDAETGFDRVFRDSIRESVEGIVGEGASKALLFYLKFPESADRPGEFVANLRSILLAGSPVVEIAIMKQLWNNIGMFSVHFGEQGTFEERVARAKELYSQRQRHMEVVAK